MTVAALALAALLAAACVVFVARPFLREGADCDDDPASDGERGRWSEERDRALAALKELEFDHRTGKISDADYRDLVTPLRRQAAEALRALDAGGERRAMRTPARGRDDRRSAVFHRAENGKEAAEAALAAVFAPIDEKEAEIETPTQQTDERVQRARAHASTTVRMTEPYPPPEIIPPSEPAIPEPYPPDEGTPPDPVPTPAPGEPTPGPDEPTAP